MEKQIILPGWFLSHWIYSDVTYLKWWLDMLDLADENGLVSTISTDCEFESFVEKLQQGNLLTFSVSNNVYSLHICSINTWVIRKKGKTTKVSSKIPIEERDQNFYKDVAKFHTKYDKLTLRNFYNYWSERTHDTNPKMRFELQKTFEVSKRLATWYGNNSKFNNGQQAFKPAIEQRRDEIKQVKQDSADYISNFLSGQYPQGD